jgi:hypothetical protein
MPFAALVAGRREGFLAYAPTLARGLDSLSVTTNPTRGHCVCIANRGREDHFFFADPPRVMSACARKGSLDIRHLHLGFNRVGNETIFMGGMMHSIELFRTGLSVVAPRNLWA